MFLMGLAWAGFDKTHEQQAATNSVIVFHIGTLPPFEEAGLFCRDSICRIRFHASPNAISFGCRR